MAMEWSMVLESHPLDLMEWQWFSMVLESNPLDLMEWQWFSMVFNGFGEPSIGLDEMSTVFNGSQPLAKQSIVFNGFNGWKATIGINRMTVVFGETTIGLDGFQW